MRAGDAGGISSRKRLYGSITLACFFFPLGLTADTDMTLTPAWYDTRVAAGVMFLVVLLRVLWRT